MPAALFEDQDAPALLGESQGRDRTAEPAADDAPTAVTAPPSATPEDAPSATPSATPAGPDVPEPELDWDFSDYLAGGSQAEATAYVFERSQWLMRTTGEPDDGMASVASPEVVDAATADALANEGIRFAGTYRVAALEVEERPAGRVLLCRDWTGVVVVADGEVYPFERMEGVAPTDQVELTLQPSADGEHFTIVGYEHQGPC